jgi:hypothetical protein
MRMLDANRVDPRKIVAVVYDDGVAVDLLLGVFAENLAARGVRVGGTLQVPPPATGCGPLAPRCVRDVATGEIHPVCRVDGAGECHFDTAKLREAAARIRSASEGGADILFFSRFGKEEGRGGGLCKELAQAVDQERPALTAVRRGLVHNWLAFTGGIGTLLHARLWVLEDWWRGLYASRPANAATVVPVPEAQGGAETGPRS